MCKGVVYIPPDQSRNSDVIERHIRSISSVSYSLKLHDLHLLFGDFNLPDVSWNFASTGYAYPEASESISSSLNFLDGMSLLNMKQLNVTKNCLNRILDLFFVNDEALPMCTLMEPHEALVPVDPMHPPLLTSLQYTAPIKFSDQDVVRMFDFAKTDFVSLNEAMREIDWSTLSLATDVNVAVSIFNHTLLQLLPSFVPASRPRQSPRWANNHLRHLKRKRSKALRKFSSNRVLLIREDSMKPAEDTKHTVVNCTAGM